MEFALLTIWIGLPALLLLMSLWSRLEQETRVRRGKKRSQEPQDLMKQVRFTSACSIVTYLLDRFILNTGSVEANLPYFLPLPVLRLLLYPAVLFVGAMWLGGTPRPKITKAPRPSERKRGGGRP